MEASNVMSRKDLQTWLKARKLKATGTTDVLRQAYRQATGQQAGASHTVTSARTTKVAAVEKRAKRYRSAPTNSIRQRIDRARTQRLYLVQRTDFENGQGKFVVLGSTGNVYEVVIAEIPHCSCPDHAKGNLCKHILFVMLKVVGLDPSSPLVYQAAYLQSELREIFALLQSRRVGGSVLANEKVQSKYASLQGGGSDDPQNGVARKSLDADSDCPICFDNMEAGSSLTYCKATCGANFHSACIQRWLNQNRHKPTCPNCRQEWVDENTKKGVGLEGYANLGALQGQSPVRDTSTYSEWSPYGKRRRY